MFEKIINKVKNLVSDKQTLSEAAGVILGAAAGVLAVFLLGQSSEEFYQTEEVVPDETLFG